MLTSKESALLCGLMGIRPSTPFDKIRTSMLRVKTPDPHIVALRVMTRRVTNEVLYFTPPNFQVDSSGFEPLTLSLQTRCSTN